MVWMGLGVRERDSDVEFVRSGPGGGATRSRSAVCPGVGEVAGADGDGVGDFLLPDQGLAVVGSLSTLLRRRRRSGGFQSSPSRASRAATS